MSAVHIASIVEGDGEVTAFPVLLRRMIQHIDPTTEPVAPLGFRHPSGSMLRTGGLERAINAVCELYRDHSIIVLLDSDDDCPKQLGPELADRARVARPDVEVSIVLAHREYEAWFLAAAESLAGRRNLPMDLTAPPDPEEIRDAKGWLSKQMASNLRYGPTQDQAALSAVFDLEAAKLRSRSFRKLWKVIETILQRTT